MVSLGGMDMVKVCPRCGEPFSYVERRKGEYNDYLYAVHVEREGKKRRIKKCYLGPADSYKNVTHMHTEENLELKGLMDKNRAVEYVNRLLNYISVNYNEMWGNEEAAALALRRLASKLQDIADRIAPQQTPQQGIERIELSEEDYNAIMQYYGRRVKCPESIRKRAKELFERIFSKGEKIIVVK